MLFSRLVFYFAAVFLSPVLCINKAWADSLADFREAGLQISLSYRSGAYDLSFKPIEDGKTSGRYLNPSILFVENPNRLVIDVPGFPAGKTRNIALTDSQFSQIRIGQHPDRLRLVLDFKVKNTMTFEIGKDLKSKAVIVHLVPEKAEPYQVSLKNSRPTQDTKLAEKEALIRKPSVSVEIETLEPQGPESPSRDQLDTFEEEVENSTQTAAGSPPDTAAAIAPEVIKDGGKTETPHASNYASPRTSTAVSPSVIKEPTDSTRMLEEKTILHSPQEAKALLEQEVAAATSAKHPAVDRKKEVITSKTGSAVIKAIYYQSPKSGTASLVKLDVDGLNTYSLRQVDPSHYELWLSNTTLAGDYLSLPQFPPDTFTGFQVVSARQEGTDSVLDVYIDEGMKVMPYLAEGKLWLKVVK